MAKAATLPGMQLDNFAFFTLLHQFYVENRKVIRRDYRDLTKKFLDFNDPDNGTAFLRAPQFEALEMYVFLKEYLDNRAVHELFEMWRDSSGKFENRAQLTLFEDLNKEQ